MQRENHKNGYIMLVLLIGVVILAILYMIDLTAMFGPIGKTDIYAERPWFEEKRLLDEKDFPILQTGKKGKVVISEQTKLTSSAQHNNENRGNIEITIDPNGKAYGRWNCAYQYPDSGYTIVAEFAGNIDPTKIYEDKTGKNKQLLYFITKGNSQQTKTDIKTNNQLTSEEVIYVVGWIQKDYSAKGKLFLMTEEGGNAEYDWQTNQSEPNAVKNK
ncbi:MAG: hypothetical protein ABSE89_04620 [Sedimentisphaerales bacterium]